LRAFQFRLLQTLQTTGQTAFYVAYEDLQDVDVINGMAKFLGHTEQLNNLSKKLKKQNPSSLRDKVANYDEMAQALGTVDMFDLGRTPNFEPRRGPNVPSYVAARSAPLMYIPLRAGPEDQIREWLALLDDVSPDQLQNSFNQGSLRKWKRQNLNHRTFTVLRHPLARAHAGFCRHILSTGKGSFKAIRDTLGRVHNVQMPDDLSGYTVEDHKTAFTSYLKFLKGNLNGQTSVRVDPVWATQHHLLQGIGDFALPDVLVREDTLERDLKRLVEDTGCVWKDVPEAAADVPFELADIYDETLEALAQEVYQRDYVMFGFDRWRA